MDGHNDLCLCGDGLFDLVRVDVHGVASTVHQHGLRLKIQRDLCAGRKGHGWDKHLITFFHSYSIQGQMQGGRAGIHRNGMLTPDISGKIRFELSHSCAGGQPAGAERVHHGLDLILGDIRHVEW
jgi:hypothetical protein